jgi:hypothetical protein
LLEKSSLSGRNLSQEAVGTFLHSSLKPKH